MLLDRLRYNLKNNSRRVAAYIALFLGVFAVIVLMVWYAANAN
jgi:predicted nucleic acid-binding Zn ribbon protein